MTAPPALDEAHCLAVVWQAAKPRAVVSVSEWADRHRVLTSKQSGEPGRFRTDRNPIMREIQDCFSPVSRVREVVLMCSAQLLKTEVIINGIASSMHQAPGPMMILNPTIEAAIAWKVQKWNPVMTDTPAIRDLFGGQRSRDAANRQDLIDFPGGVLFLAGGNSPNSYAAKSVRMLWLDDLDRFPKEIAGEGDPVFLARQRLKSFRNGKLMLASTPTTEDDSLIYQHWLLSDMRRCYLPCPHCGEFQHLEWGSADTGYGIKWNTTMTEAVYICRACGTGIAHHHKPEMLANHRWIASAPGVARRGYHASTLYAPLGLGPSWLDLAREWKDAQQNTSTLQAFINTNLGEVWKGKGEAIDSNALLQRLEDYDCTAIRAAGSVLTVGIDVQKSRIEMSVMHIGIGEETWYETHLILEGDTAGVEVWDELHDHMAEIRPDCGGIDSGYNTDQVVAFAKKYPWLFVCKGIEGKGKALIEDDVARKQRLRRKRKKGISPFLVSNHAGMPLITQRLALPLPEEPGKPAAGVVHFPRRAEFDDEFFAQLASNKLEEKVVRGKRTTEWKERKPNEAYDCWKYAMAGYRLSKLDPAARAKARAAAAAAPQSPPVSHHRPGGFVKGWKRR